MSKKRISNTIITRLITILLTAALILPLPAYAAVETMENTEQGQEQVLEEELKGYTEYKSKVKYRLLPFVW